MNKWIKTKKNSLPDEHESVLTACHHKIYGWLYSTGHWSWYEQEKLRVWHGGNSKPKYWMRFKLLKEKENK